MLPIDKAELSLKKKNSDRAMEVKLSALLGNNDRPTNRLADRLGHREVILPIRT